MMLFFSSEIKYLIILANEIDLFLGCYKSELTTNISISRTYFVYNSISKTKCKLMLTNVIQILLTYLHTQIICNVVFCFLNNFRIVCPCI